MGFANMEKGKNPVCRMYSKICLYPWIVICMFYDFQTGLCYMNYILADPCIKCVQSNVELQTLHRLLIKVFICILIISYKIQIQIQIYPGTYTAIGP